MDFWPKRHFEINWPLTHTTKMIFFGNSFTVCCQYYFCDWYCKKKNCKLVLSCLFLFELSIKWVKLKRSHIRFLQCINQWTSCDLMTFEKFLRSLNHSGKIFTFVSCNFQFKKIGFIKKFKSWKFWHCTVWTLLHNQTNQTNCWKKWNFLGFLRKIQISIDDSLCLIIICSHFVSIKSWKIRVFSKFAKSPVTLPYKYLYLILLITKKPGHI